MFEVEAGRSTAVQPHQPAVGAFRSDTTSMVADHLDSLLGEQLLPLRTRQGDADEPYLLAVDAAGQPVVVEVVAVLDEAACIRSMRHAGRAARLSTQDLARAYRGGPEKYAEHLAAFRETVPVTALLSPSVRGGARLLLVCSDVAESAADVVEFMLQPGWQIEILQVGVLHDALGRRIVDVSPVVRTPPPRRAMEPDGGQADASEPGPLRLVRPGSAADAGQGQVAGHRGAITQQNPRVPAPEPVRTPVVARPAVTQPAPGAPSWSSSGVPAPGIADLPRPSAAPTIVPPPFAASVVAGPGPRSTVPGGPITSIPGPIASVPGAPRPQTSSSAQPAPVREPAPAPAPSASLPYAFTGTLSGGRGPDPRLQMLAAEIGEPMPLVWSRQRRGTRYEAVLRTDGFIELADGSVHGDPDSAAEVASDAESSVDGWRVWRMRGDGPTLGDALEI